MALLIALLACTPPPGSATGTLVDARTHAPVPGAEIRLTTTKEGCPPIVVATDTDGTFSAEGLCGETPYTAAPADPGWYLAEPVAVTGSVALSAWRAPATPGVYTVTGPDALPLVTHTLIDRVKAFGTDTDVLFPVEIPGALPRIAGDTVLLVVGDVLGKEPRFEPLVPSPEKRWFGTKEAPAPIDPWVYLGVRFTSDTELVPVVAKPDPAHIVRVPGDRPLTYIDGGALSEGRYALLTPDATRAFLLDFGERL
jgi:hypothetical protein